MASALFWKIRMMIWGSLDLLRQVSKEFLIQSENFFSLILLTSTEVMLIKTPCKKLIWWIHGLTLAFLNMMIRLLWLSSLLPYYPSACTYKRSWSKGACTQVNPNLSFLGDKKNLFALYLTACHEFWNLPSCSKIPDMKLLFHSSIRFSLIV